MLHDLVIAGIKLGRIIGAGATGVVHAGTVLATGQEVAVKIVRPQPGQPQRLVERTVQEGRVGWAVRHPNVVRVHEWGMADGGAAYIVMERLEGENLAERLVTHGRLPADAVIAIARQITRALAAIHAEGGVHRDVKPENVFLCQDPADRVKLLDLGIVHLGEDHPARLVRTGVGLVVGTLGYLSPEQARGGAIDRRADLYALGATLYHALVGAPPHPDGDVVEVLRYIALTDSAPTLPDDVPAPLAALVRALLAPRPDDRPPDADAVLAALDRAAPAIEDDDTSRHIPIEDPFPAMHEIADHQQIRAGIIAAVARAIRTGDGPPELPADLAALDQLKNRRRTGSVRARDLRRQVTALATDLDERRRLLDATLRQYEAAQADVRDRYLQSTTALMEIADSIEDIDRRSLRHYEELDALLGGEVSDPKLIAGRNVPHCLAEMEALHQSRAFFADEQATVRTRLRSQHRAMSGINLQIIEIKRELLAIEAERQATLVALEDALRAAEDEVLLLDREIEHQFLRLGFVVQAHQAQRQRGAAGEYAALGGDGMPRDGMARDGMPRRPQVVGTPSDRRSVNRAGPSEPSAMAPERPADRASVSSSRPADRASVSSPRPADRASVSSPRPADRASVSSPRPAERASPPSPPPLDRTALPPTPPADRAAKSSAPSDRKSVAAQPIDRAALSAAPTGPVDLLRSPAERAAFSAATTQPVIRITPADPTASPAPRPADRASLTAPRPADRASLAAPRPADRASLTAPRPADRASLTAPRPADRASLAAPPRPANRASQASPRIANGTATPDFALLDTAPAATTPHGTASHAPAPHAPAPHDTAPHDTAPHDTAPHEPLPLPDATDPDRQPPRATDELVSPGWHAHRREATGAAITDRSTHPPPLPAEASTTSTDRRAAPRMPCALRVEVEGDGERALLTSRDLGVAGVFVFSPRIRPTGARVALVLHLGRGRLSIGGQVMHGQPGVGYGIRFDPPEPALRRRLERFITQADSRGRAE